MECTLCLIAKNEEKTLPRCLESVKGLFKRVIVVDTGSTDRTREEAARFGADVYQFEWVYSFSAARNYAFSLAKTEYAMWLDADDIIPPSSREELSKTLLSLDKELPDMVFMPYCVGFDENGRVNLSFRRERIIRLGRGHWFEGDIHEAIPPCGLIAESKAQVWHLGKDNRDPKRNIDIFERIIASGRELNPREQYYYARELASHGRIDEAKVYYSLCIDNPRCWVENRVSACCETAELYLRENELDTAEKYLLRSLELARPRADMCCRMGYIFFMRGDLETSAFWYKLAPRQFNQRSAGFIHADYGGYIPYIQLAVIYDRLGDCVAANRFNELAGRIKPNSRQYLHNKAYFEAKLRK